MDIVSANLVGKGAESSSTWFVCQFLKQLLLHKKLIVLQERRFEIYVHGKLGTIRGKGGLMDTGFEIQSAVVRAVFADSRNLDCEISQSLIVAIMVVVWISI